jgi:transcriptional regulator with XRE-family HTH domain
MSDGRLAMSKRGKAQGVPATGRGSSPSDPSAALLAIIAANLKRLRTRQGHSLERLANLAGVSRAMLSQIETGKSVPTISLLLKVANALSVPIANLLITPASHAIAVLPRRRAKILSLSAGRFSWRALFPLDADRRAEFYEVRLAAQHRELLEARAPGARENLVVVQGKIELTAASEEPVVLAEGDAAALHADVPRSIRNLSEGEAIIHIVVTYLEPVAPGSPGLFSGA